MLQVQKLKKYIKYINHQSWAKNNGSSPVDRMGPDPNNIGPGGIGGVGIGGIRICGIGGRIGMMTSSTISGTALDSSLLISQSLHILTHGSFLMHVSVSTLRSAISFLISLQ